MNTTGIIFRLGLLAIIGMSGCARTERHGTQASASANSAQPAWRDKFDVNKAELAPVGNNSYLPIQPGKVLKLADGKDRLTVTILPGTKTVDGVATAIFEEREEKNGKLIEVSHNYF